MTDPAPRWELAHRSADAEQSTTVELEAPGSWDAVEQLQAQLVDGDRVLYVRRLT